MTELEQEKGEIVMHKGIHIIKSSQVSGESVNGNLGVIFSSMEWAISLRCSLLLARIPQII